MPISQSNSTNSLSTELDSALNALSDKKAENIRLLDVSDISSITDYIVFPPDNGITITVPPFIESGDKIIIDSRNLEYVKKIT